MQLRGLLFLGLLLGAEGTRVVRHHVDDAHLDRRQLDSNTGSPTGSDQSSTDAVTSSSSSSSSSSPIDQVTTSTSDQQTSTTADQVTTSSSSAQADDTTILQTVTVTDDNASAVTKKTTIQKTVVSTVIVTSTLFETQTVTSEGATSTSTVYSTTTVWANERRGLNLAPRTVDSDGFVIVDAKPTGIAESTQDDEQYDLKALLRRQHLAERALVTKKVTVTVGGNAQTVTQTITQTVISPTRSVRRSTRTVTETEVAGASTTITTTSILTITSTRVTTGVVATSTGASSDSTTSSNGSDGSSGSSSSSSGLSTGAKAGIGAGAGVVALAALGVILWCCLKRRHKPSKSEIDDMFGSSEVPVGGVRGNNTTSPHMTQANHGVESGLAPGRMATKNEGYRGTAIGDGRTGYAKPSPYGAAYNNAVSPETAYSRTATASPGQEDRLPLHPSAAEMDSPANTAELGNDNVAADKWHNNNAAEIDSHPVASARPAAPAEHVYEMPAQPYR